MKLVGYVRTHLFDDVAEEDLAEQERSMAEFCLARNLELTSVLTDEPGFPQQNLSIAIANEETDGIVVTDPLVLADDLDVLVETAWKLQQQGKHLYVLCHDKHFDPAKCDVERELVDFSMTLLDRKVS